MSANHHVIRATVIGDITAERRRQIDQEGWTPEHDDTHAEGGYDNGPALSQAAACYALGSPTRWPWDEEWWKPSDHRRNCVKAAALLIAEIERLDRAAASGTPTRRAETTGSVGEADGGPAPKGDAQP